MNNELDIEHASFGPPPDDSHMILNRHSMSLRAHSKISKRQMMRVLPKLKRDKIPMC